MSVYFSHFPIIDGSRDITRRVNVFTELLDDPHLFLPVELENGERPEDIANAYYGSVDYTWVVLLSNDIHDPYEEWYKSSTAFELYIKTKYQSLSGKKGYDIIAWTQDTSIRSNIVAYKGNVDDQTVYCSTETYQNAILRTENGSVPVLTEDGDTILIEPSSDTLWSAVRIYDYEERLNTSRKFIQVLNKLYLTDFVQEFKTRIA